jgi:threonine dehydrogenase-like Zn-dependent dehydrogenase
LGDGKVGVIEIEEPAPPGPDQVQLDVAYCGVCGSDLHMVEYGYFPPNDVLGHELSGTVRQLGSHAQGFDTGQPVTVIPMLGCGECDECRAGRSAYCRSFVGIGTFQGLARDVLVGGMAPRINVPAQALYALPEGVALEHGAIVEPLAVAHHAVRAVGPLGGRRVVVMGAGPIGAALMTCARRAGAETIVVTEPIQARRERAKLFGADQALDNTRPETLQQVQELTGGGADVVFEAVGLPGTLNEAVQLVRPGGRIQVVGCCMQVDPILPALWLSKEPLIQISFVYSPAEFAQTIELIQKGELQIADYVSRAEPLEKIEDVFDSLHTAKRDNKVLLRPNA